MLIQEMLRRFGPVYAADGEGGAAPAAEVVPVVPPEGAASAGDDLDLPDDLDLEVPEVVEPEYEDYDLDGIRIKVPKDSLQHVKDGAYRQSDYTVKTKEIAAAKKAADEARANYEARAAEDDEIREGIFHLKNIDADLNKRYAYFQSPEYRELREADPLGARNLRDDFEDDKGKRETLRNVLLGKQQERNSKAADEAKAKTEADSRLREQAAREVAKKIPGWNSDLQAKVRASAIANGFDAAAIDGITDSKHWETLFYAEFGRRAYAQKARAGAGAVRPGTTTASTRTVGQGAAPAGSPVAKMDKASPDDYVAMRRKQQGG